MSNHKTLVGRILTTASSQSAVVEVEVWKTDRIMKKRYRRTKRYLVHNPNDKFKSGQKVAIGSVRPLSRRKSWVILEPERS